jgi:atypical dual specificity phosphatase
MLSFPAQRWQKVLSSVKSSGTLGVASLITPRLYLSDYGTARNSKKLEELGITHIISVIECRPDLPEVIPQTQRFHLPLPDTPEANIVEHLDATTAFIKAALEENETNKVLVSNQSGSSLTCSFIYWQVHCMQGISRSATVVCAYLIATTNLNAGESIAHVQSLRGIVCPNLGFRKQLEEYAKRYVEDKPEPYQTLPEWKWWSGFVVRKRSLRV